jgi:hypothetical protein
MNIIGRTVLNWIEKSSPQKVVLTFLAIPVVVGAVGGCASQLAYWNSLTPAQQITLAATIVNGACVVTAQGAGLALTIDTIVQPAGSSTAGTIVKVAQIGAASCATLNGALATLSTGTTKVTATVAPAS